MRRAAAAAGGLILLLVVPITMRDFLTRQLLYPAPPYRVPSSPPEPLVEVQLEVDGRRVVGWAGEPEALGDDAPVVLFFHGNGENLATLWASGLYQQLLGLEVAFLALDYPGYGRSQGRSSERGLVAAGLAASRWAASAYPGRETVAVGWSLGAAVAIQVAAATADPSAADLDALVLISAWDDLPTLAAVHFPSWLVRLALSERYDSRAAARRLDLPVLLIHGRDDRIIPLVHGRRLHQEFAPEARFVEIPDRGHNDLLDHPRVWHELAAFLHRR